MPKTVKSAPHAPAKKPGGHARFWRILLTAGIVLLLFIPTYLAVAHYRYTQSLPETRTDADYYAVTLTDAAGNRQTAQLEENAEPTLLRLVCDLVEHKSESAETPVRTPDYTLSMQNQLGTDVFYAWFDEVSADCLLEDAAGTVYRAAREDTVAFLCSTYAAALYAQAVPPVLTTAATDEVTPTSLSWYYQLYNNEFAALTDAVTTDEVRTYPIANDIDFYFSIQPSSYNVIITRDGSASSFSQNDKISLSHLSRGDLLDVTINARFEPSSLSAYYGEAAYHFMLRVAEAAQFEIDAKTAVCGSYFLVICKNVNNVQNLEFSGWDLAPILFSRNGVYYAAFPAGEAGEYTLTARYGTVMTAFDLTVSPTQNDTHDLNATNVRGALADLDLEVIAARTARYGSTAASEFFTPSSLPAFAAAPAVAFGDALTDGTLTVHAGGEYYITNSPLCAPAPGRVLAVGTDDVLGAFAVIDHGCGLYTWYCGLDQVRVSAGGVVAAGDTLGVTGTSGAGIGTEAGFLFIVTLGTTPIDPQVLRDGTFFAPAN